MYLNLKFKLSLLNVAHKLLMEYAELHVKTTLSGRAY